MKRSLLLTLLSVFAITVNAQWNPNPASNNLVCGTSPTTAKTANVAVSDGAGGMFLAWIDSRTTSNQTVFIQRILADGTLKFTNEVVVTQATGATSSSKSNLAMDADGAGGVVLTWQDTRNFTAVLSNSDIYGQRVNADGGVLWTADGRRLTVSDNAVSNKLSPSVATINATEAVVIFSDNRAGNNDVFAQKILLATGATQWASDVSIHGAQTGTQTSFSILPDGANGAFIVWQDPRVATTNSEIYAQRLDNTGALLWGASGTVICNALFNQLTPQLVSDGAGGIVVAWQDNRASSADGDIWAQRVNAAGIAQWTANGVAVCIQVGTNQSNPYLVAGGAGYIIVWSDPRVAVGNRHIYANSIDNAGVAQWTSAATGGVAVCTAIGNQPGSSTQSGIQIISDGSNGAVVVWDDARNGSSALDMYAQRLNSLGVTQWAVDGVAISTAANNQQGPVVVNSLLNNVMIAWRDGRNGTANGQLFASLLQLSGVLPVTFTGINATLLNEVVTISWQTAGEWNAGEYIVERSDDGFKFYSIGTVTAKGISNSSYSLIDPKPVTGNVFYRIQSIDKNRLTQYSLVARVTTGKKGIFVNLYPLPATSSISIQLGNFNKGNYQLQITDSKGSLVKKQTITVTGTSMLANLNLQLLQSGNYFVQVIAADGTIVKTSVIQKL